MINFFNFHKKKILYVIVGAWNTLFGYGVFVLLQYYLSNQLNYILILVISYILSITNAFIGYKVFVFKTKGNILKEYLKFYLIYGGVFVFNILTLPFFVEVLLLDIYVAQAVVTFITIFGSYLLHKRFSFK